MDEAASKVRLAVFNLPPDLREMQDSLDELEEARWKTAASKQDLRARRCA